MGFFGRKSPSFWQIGVKYEWIFMVVWQSGCHNYKTGNSWQFLKGSTCPIYFFKKTILIVFNIFVWKMINQKWWWLFWNMSAYRFPVMFHLRERNFSKFKLEREFWCMANKPRNSQFHIFPLSLTMFEWQGKFLCQALLIGLEAFAFLTRRGGSAYISKRPVCFKFEQYHSVAF